MDGMTLLIAAGVIVVLGLLVYLISVTGVKEKSYDEAMAEQRRAIQESKVRTERLSDVEEGEWGRIGEGSHAMGK